MLTLIFQLLTILADKDIHPADKVRFFPLLAFSLLSPRSDKNMKRTYCLDGRFFFYLGSHKNLMLDHLVSHLNVYKKYYLDADVVVDVGASFGTFPRILSYFVPQADIYCIEMARPSFEVLKINTASLSQTKCFRYALGDRNKMTKFYYNDQYPEGSLINSREKSNSQVVMITLDDFISRNKITHISLLKIDTERFELHVLRGAKHTLTMTKHIIIETELSGSNLKQVEKILDDAGFILVNIGEINFNYESNRIGSLDLVFRKK